MRLPLKDIVWDEEMYPRNSVDWLTVYRYIEAKRAGSTFPPIVVGRRAGIYVGIDGRHRYVADEKLKRPTIPVIVKRIKPALFFEESVRLNSAHGRPLSVQERVAAIVRLRQEGYADAKIAKVLWIPIVSVQKLVLDRVERLPLQGNKQIVRKAPVPKGRLQEEHDQQSLAARSQVHLLRQVVDLFEGDLVEAENQEVVALVDRLRAALEAFVLPAGAVARAG